MRPRVTFRKHSACLGRRSERSRDKQLLCSGTVGKVSWTVGKLSYLRSQPQDFHCIPQAVFQASTRNPPPPLRLLLPTQGQAQPSPFQPDLTTHHHHQV
ncbi:hypothetical protein CesoFtcFv8_004651 [Champsocephalus esox]|uniref:Uncharacterized protein n=1 Tax=Champsocephalus esox TaxID=159716 RepID=A0AAN8CQI6_9TELE|nr:hypothetical protein CesoFtcFv8_004651 [Champsocephalus esox]